MRRGSPTVALILTEDERVRLDSLAHRFRTAPRASRANRARLCREARQHGGGETLADVAETVCSGAAGFFAIGSTGCMTSRVPAPRGGSAMSRLSR